jgi:Cu-Zn family superoxide dismutase
MNRGALLLPLLLAACATPRRTGPTPPTRSAIAYLRDSSGTSLGTAEVIDRGADSIEVAIITHGLTPGAHGAHLHAVGRCDGPAFASAGGHLNLAGHQHGLLNPAGPHSGDMPNLVDGRLRKRLAVPFAALFDEDGTAIVVHAAEDDQRTDPSGNSGARVLCGVLTESAGRRTAP